MKNSPMSFYARLSFNVYSFAELQKGNWSTLIAPLMTLNLQSVQLCNLKFYLLQKLLKIGVTWPVTVSHHFSRKNLLHLTYLKSCSAALSLSPSFLVVSLHLAPQIIYVKSTEANWKLIISKHPKTAPETKVALSFINQYILNVHVISYYGSNGGSKHFT